MPLDINEFTKPILISDLGGGLSPVQEAQLDNADSGYAFTGGFADRLTGNSASSDIGTYVNYSQAMVDNDQWLRFAFSPTAQANNDNAYWTDPDPNSNPNFDQSKGLFGGLYLPPGFDSMISYDFDESPGYSDGVTGQSLNYTAADGSFDFSDAEPGDFCEVRFDFQVRPQVANTTIQIAMIWQTRLADGTPTFTFPLTGTPLFYGTGTTGKVFLNRPVLTAYFASEEDVNAKALLAIKSDNPVEIAPLTTLVRIAR